MFLAQQPNACQGRPILEISNLTQLHKADNREHNLLTPLIDTFLEHDARSFLLGSPSKAYDEITMWFKYDRD